MKYYIGNIPYGNDLTHFGIKGMHWGIRRFQNPDGTLTPAGKARYSQGKDYENYFRKQSESDHKRIKELESRISSKSFPKRLLSKETWKDANELVKLRENSRTDDALLRSQVRRNEKFDRKYNSFGTSNKPNEAFNSLNERLSGESGINLDLKRDFEKYGRSKTVNKKNVSFQTLYRTAEKCDSKYRSRFGDNEITVKGDPNKGTISFYMKVGKLSAFIPVSIKQKNNGFDIAALYSNGINGSGQLSARAINEFEKELEKALNKR